jgi:type I restriction enzyme M protein
MDIHKIVDVFNRRLEVPKYSRMVSVDEIEKNEFNLNLPRYIDSQQAEDIQDIEGHLRGGIPSADVDALAALLGRSPRSSVQALFMVGLAKSITRKSRCLDMRLRARITVFTGYAVHIT